MGLSRIRADHALTEHPGLHALTTPQERLRARVVEEQVRGA